MPFAWPSSRWVTLTAERPQTLDLLARDQTQLHRALDQAGVPAEGRSVTFHLAPAPSADPPRTDTTATVASPQSSGISAGDAGAGSDRGAQRETFSSGQRRLAAGSDDPDDAASRATHWLRAGIDITA